MKYRILRLWAGLFAKPQFEKLNNFLLDLSMRGLGILNFENESVSGEQHFISTILPKYSNGDSPILIDVGANEGGYSKLLIDTFPQATIIAFEPHPSTASKLKKDLGSRINVQQMALGSEVGTLTLFDYSNADGSQHASIYEDVIKDIHHGKAIGHTVSVDQLDAVANRLGLSDRITLIKIDTEGNELEVLKGAARLIEGGKIDVFHVEFNEMNVISRVFLRDIQNVLPDYAAFRLLPEGALRVSVETFRRELFAFQNIVFIHSRFKPDSEMNPTVIP
ncbi:MAG: FkbM family methyltransferase [Verrucomicrobiota bacterium]